MDLRSLVETAPDLIGVLDHDQRYVYVNEALERAAGADGAGLIGARADAAMAPEDARRWREALGDVLRSGRGRAIECTMGTVAGPRWFAVRLTPLPEDRACAVWRDITEVRSWQLLDVAVQAMVTGMVIAEAPSGRISFMNTASDRVFGMPSRKVHDMEDYDAVPAFDRRGRQLTNEDWPISRALAGEVMVGERVEIHGHDGTRRTVSINASPVRDRDGAIIAAVATYHDATEASRAEEAARYLAAAGALLERFDPGSSLQAIVDLAVPVLADCCLIHLETAGHPAIAAVAHTDPAKAAAARAELAAQPQLSPDTALARVLAGGPCELVTVDEAVLEQAARDPAHLARLRDQGYRSAVVAPLAGRDGVLGAVTFVMAESGRCYGEADLGVLAELARRTGIALENARLFAAEQRARRHAEEARDRTRRLQALTAALSSAVEEQRVVSIMVNAGRDALGASGGFAWLLRDDDMLELAAAELTGTLRRLEELRTFPITARLPMCDVIRTTRPMMFENLAALADGYPDAIQPGTPAFRSWAVIPFVVAGRGAGAVAFSFAQERAFTDEDRELLVAMSGQASLALERARLYEALHAREEQLRSALTAAHAATWKLDLATMTHKRDASYRALVGVQGERSTATFEGIHPDDRAAVQAQLERTVRDGVPYEPELRIRRDDGTYLWVRSHGRVIHGPDGKPSALAGVIVDIDEAKRTSLRAEEDRRINETLHRLGSSFASELDHDRLVRLITGEVAKLVGAELGAFVPSASGGDGAALHEIRSDVTERFRDADHPLAMPMLHASAAHAPRRVDDATRDPRFGAG
ncbi:MAG TPA: PAS domain S-box protein, partial [Kofleriaceae bacterium]|nr:PAS domain S-box protein [Kofleriaceae bacterium]